MNESTTRYVGSDSPSLLHRSGRGIRVAIVDSGLADGHPHVGAVAGGARIEQDESVSGDYRDRLGHGTAVAAAIREKAPSADLYAVKVFDRALQATAGQLVRALEWALDHNATVVNLSLGTGNPAHRELLADTVQRAGRQGALVVSAFESEGTNWLPGSIPDAIPVIQDDSCPRKGMHLIQRGGATLFAASGYPRPIPGVPIEHNLRGLSFAVANVTGIIARLLENRAKPPTFGRVIDWIMEEAPEPPV